MLAAIGQIGRALQHVVERALHAGDGRRADARISCAPDLRPPSAASMMRGSCSTAPARWRGRHSAAMPSEPHRQAGRCPRSAPARRARPARRSATSSASTSGDGLEGLDLLLGVVARRAVLHHRGRRARGRRAGSARPSANERSPRRSRAGRRSCGWACASASASGRAWQRRCRRPGPRRPAGASCAPASGFRPSVANSSSTSPGRIT